MRGGGGRSRSFCGAPVVLILLSAAPVLAGCSTDSYVGIPLAPGAVDSELRSLAIRAQAGDKQAQLELGIRYEEGRGVRTDLRRARRLYAVAARDSGGSLLVYTPPVGQAPGGLTRLEQGPRVGGLEAAKRRLSKLDAQRR